MGYFKRQKTKKSACDESALYCMCSLWMTAGTIYVHMHNSIKKEREYRNIGGLCPIPEERLEMPKQLIESNFYWFLLWTLTKCPKIDQSQISLPLLQALISSLQWNWYHFICVFLSLTILSLRVAHYSLAGKETGASPHYRVNKFGCSRGLPLWDADYN